MFLVPTLPYDATRLTIYCDALLAAFDATSFEQFYADFLGRILENEVDTTGGFKDVLFRLLLKSQHDGTLLELLVAALCYRAGNSALVDVLDDVLAVPPIVKLAAFLAERHYPPSIGQEAVDALYTERLVRKRPWVHHEGRAAWIEVLVVCDKLPTVDEPSPPLIACLNTIDRKWKPRNGSSTLREQIDKICIRYGIQSVTGALSAPTLSDSLTALSQAHGVEAEAGAEAQVAPEVVREHRLLPALKSAWRAATSDGQGAYQLAMICFGLTAFLFHHSLNPQKLERDYLKESLTLEQEPLRAERYPILAGLLLPSMNAPGAATNGARQQLCNEALIKALDEAYRKFRDAYNKKEHAYKYELNEIDQAPTPELDRSWTDSDGDTTLLIPGSLVSALMRRPSPSRAGISMAFRSLTGGRDSCAKSEPGSQLDCVFHDQIERSLAISMLEQFRQDKSATPGMPRISSFYFIGLEGIQRSTPHLKPEHLLDHHGFNGESYVYRALSNDRGIFSPDDPTGCKLNDAGEPNKIGTHPYFDLFGSGVQETACYPVEVSTPPSRPKVVGVLCADIAVPLEVILPRLEEASKVFDLSVVKLTDDNYKGHDDKVDGDKTTGSRADESRIRIQSCRDFHAPCSPRLAQIDEEESWNLARAYHHRMRPASASESGPSVEGGVTRLKGDYFGVVVAADTLDQGPWYIAVGKLRTSRSRNYTSLTLCALTLLTGVSVLVLSFRRKLRRQQALLARGLQQGLLEIEDGRIIGGNDRAEEILDTELPRLGTRAPESLTKKTLSGMLEEERCVLVPASGQLRESDIRTYDSTIRDRTSDGLSSTFYAHVKGRRRRWIKIISTVILTPDNREHVFCTLDTNIDEAHRLFLANLNQGDQ